MELPTGGNIIDIVLQPGNVAPTPSYPVLSDAFSAPNGVGTLLGDLQPLTMGTNSLSLAAASIVYFRVSGYGDQFTFDLAWTITQEGKALVLQVDDASHCQETAHRTRMDGNVAHNVIVSTLTGMIGFCAFHPSALGVTYTIRHFDEYIHSDTVVNTDTNEQRHTLTH